MYKTDSVKRPEFSQVILGRNVISSEVSSFQRLKCMQECINLR